MTDGNSDKESQKKNKGSRATAALGDSPAWPVQGNSVDSRIHRRCTWLNCNVFWEGAIDRSAMEGLSSLDFSVAMELCKDVEAKGPDRVANPSAYLQTAVNYEQKNPRPSTGEWPNEDWKWREYEEPYWGSKGGYDKEYVDDRVHRRCTWLNANVFWASAISEKAIGALSSLPIPRAMELCMELETKGPDRVANPSGYIEAAVSREVEPGWEPQTYSRPAYDGSYINDNVHRRCTWLNTNVFWPGAIDEGAIASLSTIDYRRAMEMLKDIEDRGPNGVAHPSSYLVGSVRHEHEYNSGVPSYGSSWSYGKGGKGGKGWDGPRYPPVIHRRCTWMNANLFWEGAISDEAVAKLSTLETWRAMEILEDLEWRVGEVQHPTKWIKATVDNQQWLTGNFTDTRVHRRCVWLNMNVFWEGAIDEETIRALSSLDPSRAMDLCADVEAKGPDKVADPSRYLKTAVRREAGPDNWW